MKKKGKFKKLDFGLNCNNNLEKATWYKYERILYTYYYITKYKKPIVDENVYFKPGKIYHFAKNHEKYCPIRRVLSAINTP